MQNVSDFKKTLQKDLKGSNEPCILHILTLCAIPNLVTSDEDMLAALITAKDYYFYRGEVYLANDLLEEAISTDQTLKVLDEYITKFRDK